MRVVAAFAVLNLSTVLFSAHTSSPWVSLPVRVATIALLVVGAAIPTVAALRRSASLRACRAYVYAVLAALVLTALAPKFATAPIGLPFLNNSSISAACAAVATTRRLRDGLGLAALVGTALAASRMQAVAPGQALVEPLTFVVGAAFVGIFVRRLDDRYQRVQLAETDRLRLAHQNARLEAAAAERARWQRLVHDKVLGALGLVARSGVDVPGPEARSLAGEALRAMGVGGSSGPGRSGTEPWTIAEVAARRGLAVLPVAASLPVELPTDLPADVRAAILAALDEVLANARSHAGVPSVRVGVLGDAAGLAVTVRDDGPGLAAEALQTGRFGLSHSVPGHLSTVGAHAEVTSTPGAGTVVTICWSAPPPAPPVGTRHWTQRRRLARGIVTTGGVSAAWVLLHAVAGRLCSPEDDPWPAARWALAVALALSCLPVVSTRRPVAMVGVAMASWSMFGLSALTPAGTLADWSLWANTAAIAVPVAMIFAGWRRMAILGTAAVAVATVAGLALSQAWSTQSLAVLASGLTAPAVCALGIAAARALDRAEDSLHRATEQLAGAAQRSDLMQRGLAGDARRRSQLGHDVVPWLSRICSGEVLGAAERHEVALVEAAVRDRLVAGPLATEAVCTAATAARRAGARVTLRCSPSAAPSEALRRFRMAAIEALRVAGSGSHARVSWHPEDDARAGTISVTSPVQTLDAAGLAMVFGDLGHVAQVGEDVWVEVRADESVAPGQAVTGARPAHAATGAAAPVRSAANVIT